MLVEGDVPAAAGGGREGDREGMQWLAQTMWIVQGGGEGGGLGRRPQRRTGCGRAEESAADADVVLRGGEDEF